MIDKLLDIIAFLIVGLFLISTITVIILSWKILLPFFIAFAFIFGLIFSIDRVYNILS